MLDYNSVNGYNAYVLRRNETQDGNKALARLNIGSGHNTTNVKAILHTLVISAGLTAALAAVFLCSKLPTPSTYTVLT
jgi:hypothetical protein